MLSRIDGDAGCLAGVLPGFALLELGVGPMFVAISVAAMGEVRTNCLGPRPG